MTSIVLGLSLDLVDMPSQTTSITPLAADLTRMREALQRIRVQEWNDTVAARNDYEKCAYPLSANRPLKFDQPSRDLIFKARQSVKVPIESKAELDKWCSVDCPEKGLWVRKQLSTKNWWDRDPETDQEVTLWEDTKFANGTAKHITTRDNAVALAQGMQGLAIDPSRNMMLEGGLSDLALGDGADDMEGVEEDMDNVSPAGASTSNPSQGAAGAPQPRSLKELLRVYGTTTW